MHGQVEGVVIGNNDSSMGHEYGILGHDDGTIGCVHCQKQSESVLIVMDTVSEISSYFAFYQLWYLRHASLLHTPDIGASVFVYLMFGFYVLSCLGWIICYYFVNRHRSNVLL